MIRWPFGEAGPELDPCPMISDEPSGVSSLLRQATRRFWNCWRRQGLRLLRPTMVSMIGTGHRGSGHCSLLHAQGFRTMYYCRF
ncbi:hypothetical protein GQ55_1G385100 [Panicum hallii var. hallii]|uniref:Uncharacterized protein n=1 Tax=Panicum hallii var. hallii TaxID=1504633 RepID=A0A2T7FBY4_9POAL|nr:hypothetical protein GQ55_1G385100 [Panicum hallii var. hallii]